MSVDLILIAVGIAALLLNLLHIACAARRGMKR